MGNLIDSILCISLSEGEDLRFARTGLENDPREPKTSSKTEVHQLGVPAKMLDGRIDSRLAVGLGGWADKPNCLYRHACVYIHTCIDMCVCSLLFPSVYTYVFVHVYVCSNLYTCG